MDKEVYDFGMRLKELRMKRKMTQKEVANRLGVSRNTISSYERNTLNPSLESFINLAVLYRASTDYILNLDKREMIDISDLNPSQRKFVKDMVEMTITELKRSKS